MRVDHRGSNTEQHLKTLKQDALLQQLKSATPEELDAWMDANVTNINDVKFILKRMARLLLFMYNTR